MKILVVNAGSSSLKLRLLGARDELIESVDLAVDSDGFSAEAVSDAIASWPRPEVAAHRVVHGGATFSSAVLIDETVAEQLRALTDLAPLHQPKSLAGIDAVGAALPDVPAYACFDTAFHRTLPDESATYAVPAEWRSRWGLRRYGFHGLSHAYAARRAAELIGPTRRLVVAHLGAGASLCAVADGRSIDTTMGFTPLEGLVMATRSGSVDPGLVLWLEERLGLDEVAPALEHRSGLLALAGSGDMREVARRAEAGQSDALLAVGVYLHRLAAGVASMAAALNGLDALVFTGGVGEHQPAVRQMLAARLGWLGVEVSPARNERAEPDVEITGEGARVRTLVIAAREDLQIAAEVRALKSG